MSEVMLPAGLVVLRAPAGCGKSTLARHLAQHVGGPEAVVSTDELRERITGSAEDHSHDAEVFQTRDRIVAARLRAGRTAIADSTTLTVRDYAPLYDAARRAQVPVSIVDCNVPRDVALARNASRDRTVPEHVVHSQFDRFERSPRDRFPADVRCHADDVTAVAPDGVDGSHLSGPFDIIGDVHGQLGTLHELLERLGYAPDWTHPDNRTVVLVGDLVDKGPDSVGVLDEVIAAHRAGRALVVRGNHEARLAKVLADCEHPRRRRALLLSAADTAERDRPHSGQASTLRQLAHDPRCDAGFVPLLRWLSRLPNHLVLDRGRLVVVHAAIRAHDVGLGNESFASKSARRKAEGWNLYGPSTGRRDAVTGLPERIDWVPTWSGPQTVVRGHVTVSEPEIRNNVASVDAGAGDGVALAALRWPENGFEKAAVRAGTSSQRPAMV
jgi:protein phosphatase